MNWTREKPTQPGWYWHSYRIDGFDTNYKVIAQITDPRNGSLKVLFSGTPYSSLLDDIKDGHWQGPLEIPEGPG